MSTTPSGLSSNVKSFWSRPEGKTGMIFLGLIAVGVLWGWGQVVPYVMNMLADTVHTVILCLELGGLLYLIFGEKPRLIYRLLMRQLTGLIIEIDPIGILKDNLLRANKRRDELNSKAGQLRGSKQTLQDIIAKNKETIEQDLATAEEAKKRANLPSLDPATKLRMSYEVKLRTNDAARLQTSNEKYAVLLQKVSELYDRLVKLCAGVDFFIADLEGTVREEEISYKTINTAYSAFSSAMSIIFGNAKENDLYNQDLQFLADNASMKMGQIDDMTRLSQHFMDSIDLQNGVMDSRAAAALDSYEQKLLTSGDQSSISLLNGGSAIPTPDPVPINRKTGTTGADYFKS